MKDEIHRKDNRKRKRVGQWRVIIVRMNVCRYEAIDDEVLKGCEMAFVSAWCVSDAARLSNVKLRHLDSGQAHYDPGYRWKPFLWWKSMGLGHTFAGLFGDDPDNNETAWKAAQEITKELVKLWDDNKCPRKGL